MKNEELQQMVDDFDRHVRSSLDELIDGFSDRLVAMSEGESKKVAESFRSRGWKTAAAHAMKKVNG